MSAIQEIESAIAKLKPKEVHAVADWLQKYRDDLWDEEIAVAELERVRDVLKPAIKHFKVAVQSESYGKVSDAHQLLMREWDSFEKEDLNQVLDRKLKAKL